MEFRNTQAFNEWMFQEYDLINWYGRKGVCKLSNGLIAEIELKQHANPRIQRYDGFQVRILNASREVTRTWFRFDEWLALDPGPGTPWREEHSALWRLSDGRIGWFGDVEPSARMVRGMARAISRYVNEYGHLDTKGE